MKQRILICNVVDGDKCIVEKEINDQDTCKLIDLFIDFIEEHKLTLCEEFREGI